MDMNGDISDPQIESQMCTTKLKPPIILSLLGKIPNDSRLSTQGGLINYWTFGYVTLYKSNHFDS